MLVGQMMHRPLLISGLIDFAAEVHGRSEIISQTVEGGIHRYTYRQARARILQLANVLVALGVKPGDRVATLAWNGYRHFELYYAISGIGAVCHTINPRLSPEQFVYIANHAEDSILFYDTTFQPLVDKLRPAWKTIKHYVAMTDRAHMPAGENLLCYEDLMAQSSPNFTWPELDENTASALCYTSGTTGEPKGALYTHRSTVLHAMYSLASTQESFGAGRKLLPVVPLFHVNAWGLPYGAPLTGTSLVFPGAKLDGASLFELMDAEQVREAWGVPTVWMGLLGEMKKQGRKPVGLRQVLIGGSAVPKPMAEVFERDYGINVVQGWGMTEMSPLGSIASMQPYQDDQTFDERIAFKVKAGRRCYGVEMKLVDEAGKRLPHDDVASGELFVRGNAVVSGYYKNDAATKAAIDKDGWFSTGDVGKISPDGILTIVDRAKDLVKSGGEWISSIDVENAALAHKGLANCAVIGLPHPKWDERPVLIAIKAPGADPTREEIIQQLAGSLAKWQLPDDVVFVDALPMTATGKVSKKDLRAKFHDYKFKD
jgi:3-(methylthio)propionyl---CoA ligase